MKKAYKPTLLFCFMAKRGIPLAAIEVLLKKVGAARVSDRAKQVFLDFIEQKAKEMSRDALRYAQHAGRKTIKEEDIHLVAKEF